MSDQGSVWGVASKWFEDLVGGHTKELKDPCCLRAQVLAGAGGLIEGEEMPRKQRNHH